MDQKKAESDGNPDSVGDGGGEGEMLAALISSVVANASLMVQGQDSNKQRFGIKFNGHVLENN